MNIILLAGLLVLTVGFNIVSGFTCNICDNAQDLSECRRTVKSAPGSQCHTQMSIRYGKVFFTLGVKKKRDCHKESASSHDMWHGGVITSNGVKECQKCCWKDGCNTESCFEGPIPAEPLMVNVGSDIDGGLRCNICDNVQGLSECKGTVKAGPGSQCHTQMSIRDGKVFFTLGVKRNRDCHKESASSHDMWHGGVTTSNGVKECQKCCWEDGCNTESCFEGPIPADALVETVGSNIDEGLTCNSCDNARDLSECRRTVKAGPGSQCHTEMYIRDGKVFFTLGVKRNGDCHKESARSHDLWHGGVITSNGVKECQKCCWKDGCNTQSCFEGPIPAEPLVVNVGSNTDDGGLRCNICDNAQDLSECKGTVKAGPSMRCHTEMSIRGGNMFFTLGVKRQRDCNKESAGSHDLWHGGIITIEGVKECEKCCSNDGCNTQSCFDDSVLDSTPEIESNQNIRGPERSAWLVSFLTNIYKQPQQGLVPKITDKLITTFEPSTFVPLVTTDIPTSYAATPDNKLTIDTTYPKISDKPITTLEASTFSPLVTTDIPTSYSATPDSKMAIDSTYPDKSNGRSSVSKSTSNSGSSVSSSGDLSVISTPSSASTEQSSPANSPLSSTYIGLSTTGVPENPICTELVTHIGCGSVWVRADCPLSCKM